MTDKFKYILEKVENIVGKGENAGKPAFYPFPTMFSKGFFFKKGLCSAGLIHPFAGGCICFQILLQAIGGESPRMIMEHIGDVLFVLSKNYTSQVQVWSEEIIEKDGYPSVRCTLDDKRRFFKSVLRYCLISFDECPTK